MNGVPQSNDEQLAAHIARALEEIERVQKLTTQQLVDELLEKMPFTDYDELLEEACTRLDPTWQERHADTPLDATDRSVLDKAMARFHKRLEEVKTALEQVKP